jgi:hypothetical protein
LALGAYIGGVFDPINNQIVFVPNNQGPRAYWHVYDCTTKTVLSYPRPETGTFVMNAYAGGVFDPINNQIVFIPLNQAAETEWHLYDCITKTILPYPRPETGTFVLNAYAGGVYDPLNNQIVFVPWNQAPQSQWHVYDCATKAVLSYPKPFGSLPNGAYVGGVYDPMNNQIVFVPRNQVLENEWHVYDCATKTALSYNRPAGTLVNPAYYGGVFDPMNNQIVFVPLNQAQQSHWHVYDCVTKTILPYPKPSGTFANLAYVGGVYDPMNNQVVFIPYGQATQMEWHTLQNFGAPQVSRQLAAHSLFNKL